MDFMVEFRIYDFRFQIWDVNIVFFVVGYRLSVVGYVFLKSMDDRFHLNTFDQLVSNRKLASENRKP